MKKGNEGRCFGKWDANDVACSKCMDYARMKCEESTRRKAEASAGMPAEEKQSLNDCFLRALEARIDRRVKWGEPIVTNYFNKGGKTVLFVAYNMVTGKVKVVTGKGKIRLIPRLESTEQVAALAAEVLKEVLG